METKPLLKPVDQQRRILVLDVLRGFALLGILMVNMPLFNTPFTVLMGEARIWTDQANQNALWFIDFFFHGKFYVLFSLLFGMGFYFFLRKVDEAGQSVINVFRRRLLVLLLIGALHVVLLWYGDILVIYALFGFIMTWFRKKSNRTVMVWAIVFLILPVFFSALFAAAIKLGMSVPEAAEGIKAGFLEQEKFFENLAQRALIIYSQGSFSEIMSIRLNEYSFIWGGIFAFFPFVLAMFLVGLLFGRKGYFFDISKHIGFFKKLFWYSLPFALLGNWVLAHYIRVASHTMPGIEQVYMNAGFAVGGPSMAFVYISLVVFCIHRGWLRWLTEKIAVTGRMALTNYLTQTIICTTIFYGYGFGLYGQVNIWQGIILTFVIYIIQVIWSQYWLRYFRFGPFEWAWRSLTYWKLQPLKKQ